MGSKKAEDAEEVLGLALVADDEAPEAMERGEEALHLRAPPVAPQFHPILRLAALSVVRGNQLQVALVRESLAEMGVSQSTFPQRL
ncbi:hypothetical protein [Pyxidicoccus caerfyrddinensis]|uniref:hypothetical protein n=1 Tax=Pyxidicoccus caerfyrddinensis TaxID=2709663 RepID=UPI001F088760|nr:hypothetical protein [Pyxidicoccus caerfyrddinensis]